MMFYDMHREDIIFVTLLSIMTVAIVAVGYATGRGPLYREQRYFAPDIWRSNVSFSEND